MGNKMKTVLGKLLERLEAVAEDHEEIFDTEVRERMGAACMEGFVRRSADFRLPRRFGLMHAAADARIHEALADFLSAAKEAAASGGLDTFHRRLAAFQDGAVVTDAGNDYEEFFGHSPADSYDAAGEVVRTA